MKEYWLSTAVLVVVAIAGMAFITSLAFAAPPVPSVGVSHAVLECADVQGSPTIIRFVDRSVRDASGNVMTIVCYSRATATGESEMDCVVR